jgi:hypothetical protein
MGCGIGRTNMTDLTTVGRVIQDPNAGIKSDSMKTHQISTIPRCRLGSEWSQNFRLGCPSFTRSCLFPILPSSKSYPGSILDSSTHMYACNPLISYSASLSVKLTSRHSRSYDHTDPNDHSYTMNSLSQPRRVFAIRLNSKVGHKSSAVWVVSYVVIRPSP